MVQPVVHFEIGLRGIERTAAWLFLPLIPDRPLLASGG